MIQSIYSGVSSLQSFQTGIDVLADNIANTNTIGFRGSNAEFSNLFEKSIMTSDGDSPPAQSGLGVRVNAISLDMSKGEYYVTQNPTDLAIINKDGWFGLKGKNDEDFFTRAGNFHFDPYSDGNSTTNLRLINSDGYFVTGTLANNTTGNVLDPVIESLDLDPANVDSQEPLIFPLNLTFPVEPTTQANFFGNIGTENVPRVMSAGVISPQSERNSLRLVFTQSASQPATGISWDVAATTQTPDGSTVYDSKNGVVVFDGTGGLISSTLPPLDNNGAMVVANLGTGFSGISSAIGPSVVTSSTIDGSLSGDLLDYKINRNGEVVSTFTNGKQSVVGKVAIYHFQNDQGLESIGGNKFRASNNSGKPIFYSQDNGEVLSGTLENSNVALDNALTELIVLQRSYDAASKTISTGDEMLKNALQMGV